MATEALFPEPSRVPLKKGMRVHVQTIWGDEEGTVVRVAQCDGFPLAHLNMARGDRITIDVARVKPL